MLAELRRSCDDRNAQAEIRPLWQRTEAKLDIEGERHVYARSVAGLQSRYAELHRARSADPLIAHDFETESLALIQAGHSCAFDGAYTDQHVNSAVVRLDETIALRDVEPLDGSNCHGASSHE
jgi:hypothetical protein